jgi:hypothetical protein
MLDHSRLAAEASANQLESGVNREIKTSSNIHPVRTCMVACPYGYGDAVQDWKTVFLVSIGPKRFAHFLTSENLLPQPICWHW